MLTQIQNKPFIQTPLLGQEDWLCHGFGLRGISIEQYLEAFGLSDVVVPKTKQVHGNQIHLLNGKKTGSVLEGDAFLTDQIGIVCLAQTADCLPVLFCDGTKRIVGAVHVGWRGTVTGILPKVIQELQRNWKSDLDDLKVALGPAIGGHCYHVGTDVVEALEKAKLYPGPWIEERDRDTWSLDIAFANLHLLENVGVSRKNVYLSLACTACDSAKFRSYRKEGVKEKGQINFIVRRQ